MVEQLELRQRLNFIKTRNLKELNIFLAHFISMLKLRKRNFKYITLEFKTGKVGALVVDEMTTLVKGLVYPQIAGPLRALCK